MCPGKWREKVVQPPTPTHEELQALDAEVEENQKTKILIQVAVVAVVAHLMAPHQDDFTMHDPSLGLSLLQRARHYLLPPTIHPQSDRMTAWWATSLGRYSSGMSSSWSSSSTTCGSSPSGSPSPSTR